MSRVFDIFHHKKIYRYSPQNNNISQKSRYLFKNIQIVIHISTDCFGDNILFSMDNPLIAVYFSVEIKSCPQIFLFFA